MITIRLEGNLITITPISGLGALCNELTYVHRSMVRGSMNFERVKLYSIDARVLLTSGGFYKRIKDWFKLSGISHEIIDARKLKKPKPAYENIGELRDGQAELLACIAVRDGGIVNAPTAFGKSRIIVEICNMYPTLRIAVVSSSVSVINTLYERLQKDIPPSQLGIVGGGKSSYGRITVVTSKSLNKLNPDKLDLILFDEAHQAAGPEISTYLGYFRDARMFGFTASPVGRSDGADKVVESIFGQVIYNRSYEEAVESGNVVPMDVHIYKVISPQKTFKRPMDRKVLGIWGNRERNSRIASVVNLPEYADKQVLILVDTVEHLLYLKNLLPDYTVAYDSMKKESEAKFKAIGLIKEGFVPLVSKDVQRLRVEFSERKILKMIATGVFNTGVDFPSLDICVRADGGSSKIKSIQIPGRAARISDGKEVGVLIDFMDDFDKSFKASSQKRISDYKKMGWSLTTHYK